MKRLLDSFLEGGGQFLLSCVFFSHLKIFSSLINFINIIISISISSNGKDIPMNIYMMCVYKVDDHEMSALAVECSYLQLGATCFVFL